jgi:hypothetical protein
MFSGSLSARPPVTNRVAGDLSSSSPPPSITAELVRLLSQSTRRESLFPRLHGLAEGGKVIFPPFLDSQKRGKGAFPLCRTREKKGKRLSLFRRLPGRRESDFPCFPDSRQGGKVAFPVCGVSLEGGKEAFPFSWQRGREGKRLSLFRGDAGRRESSFPSLVRVAEAADPGIRYRP